MPLPAITPEQMRAACCMNFRGMLLTGDLRAPVGSGLPPFPGTEAHLLKCMCLRLMHAYTVVPRRHYV